MSSFTSLRFGFLVFISLIITALLLLSASAFAAVTYSGLTIDTVLADGHYVARPVVLDTAGFAATTGRVATMGGSAELAVAVRASAGAASLALRGIARFCGPWCLVAAGSYELYQYMKGSGLTECGTQSSGNNGWCVKEYQAMPSGFVCGPMGGPYAGLGVMGCYLLSTSGNGGGAVCDAINGSRSGRTELMSYFGITPPDNIVSACIVAGVGMVTRAATDADFEKVSIPMPMPLIADSWPRVAGNQDLPVDAWKTVNTPTSSWLGNPYIGSDGKWHRDALIFNPANSNFPAHVRVETRTFGPADDPSQLQIPSPLPSTPQDPNQPVIDLCALNPTIIACAQQEDYYARMQSSTSGAVSSAAMTQQEYEDWTKKTEAAVSAAIIPTPSLDALSKPLDDFTADVKGTPSQPLFDFPSLPFPRFGGGQCYVFEGHGSIMSYTFTISTVPLCDFYYKFLLPALSALFAIGTAIAIWFDIRDAVSRRL